MSSVITRFAPSPTGKLHVGNARTAIVNWLYAKKFNGKFILRLDDTDLERSTEENKTLIKQDLEWLGLNWNETFCQSDRLNRYNEVKNILLEQGRLYPCFESQEELEMKRKIQLSNHKPPIYDKSALKLSKAEVAELFNMGKKAHYRFKVNAEKITWNDMVKDHVHYDGAHLSDPIVIREDGSMTYMLCSVIDDIDYKITHIIRGEDHVSNTAIQMQMFEALNTPPPIFGHLSLIKAKEEKISKRIGGFDIATLRSDGFESMAINSFFGTIGSSKTIEPCSNLADLTAYFDIEAFSKSPTTYIPEELENLNHKMLLKLNFQEVQSRLHEIDKNIDENFWLSIRPNLQKFSDIQDWWNICHKYKPPALKEEKVFLEEAAQILQEIEMGNNTWGEWTKLLSEKSGRKGKDLFLPLRLALTGLHNGPEMKTVIQLIEKSEIIKRLLHSEY